MLNVKIFVTGTLKEQYYKDAIAEYRKRLTNLCQFDIIEFKEYKLSDNPTERQIEQALSEEGDKILSSLPQRAYKIALCVEGKQMSTEEFAQKLDGIAMSHGEVCFVL